MTRKKSANKVGIPRAGMPTQDSVKEVIPFTSPGGRKYRIIKTSELDAYDAPATGKPGSGRGARRAPPKRNRGQR